MKFETMQSSVMAGSLGDIFWDIAPLIVYSPGFDLGCNLYVANPTGVEKEYALMAKLTRDNTTISEEAIPVFGYTWFKVAPGDFVPLKGALRFTESNADLTLSLIERETGAATDAVTTRLVAPTTSALPPAWPGSTGSSGMDWSTLFTTLFPFVMLVIISALLLKPQKEPMKPRVEKEKLTQGRESYAG